MPEILEGDPRAPSFVKILEPEEQNVRRNKCNDLCDHQDLCFLTAASHLYGSETWCYQYDHKTKSQQKNADVDHLFLSG